MIPRGVSRIRLEKNPRKGPKRNRGRLGRSASVHSGGKGTVLLGKTWGRCPVWVQIRSLRRIFSSCSLSLDMTFERIWQTRDSVRFRMSPISLMVRPS